MQLTSLLAIYALFWAFSIFLVLPFGVRTADEAGVAKVPGQAESAPAEFRPWRTVMRITIVASVLFGLFLLNAHYGWVTAETIDFFGGTKPVE
ncbi:MULTISPECIES: DUF1467 family protein [Sphingomonas]|uniref:DUF1467 family protein n=1 Tax=Sphingomonas TaxID=13687 RepID=UPI000835BF55|nr:DUF1467 family protein [Sphingomonas sp. CCH10-B3]MBA3879804.1 DUF1467 domain-containing protein [Sphingobium sp.]